MVLTEIKHPTHRNITKDSFPIHNTDVNPIICFCNDLRKDMVEIREALVVIGAQLDSLQRRMDNIKFTDIPVVDVTNVIANDSVVVDTTTNLSEQTKSNS